MGFARPTLAATSIREKLNLLLVVPLLATVLLAVPFVASQVDEARGATLTASAATTARDVAGLLYALQQERLAAVAHVAGPSERRRTVLLRQQALVDDLATDLRRRLDTEAPPELLEALKLSDLRRVRGVATGGYAEAEPTYRAYRRATDALLEALGPADRGGQLEILDALLRANEQSSRVGAAMLVATVDLAAGQDLLAEASALRTLHAERFLARAGAGEAALLRVVERGPSTATLHRLAEQVRTAEGDLGAGFADEVRAAAESQAVVSQLLLVRTARVVEAAASRSADAAQLAAWAVGIGTLVLFALVVTLSVAVSRSIAGPVRELTRAAGRVAELTGTELARVSDSEDVDAPATRLTGISVTSRDEVGELAKAFNRVQSTAAELLERQVHSRRNVALMFASVARRTQNLVGGQLALIDQLERDEQDPRVLAELYRLDHLSMRLRRSAESLLVVSGVRDETRIAVPASLATVLRSALAEIEDFQRVRLVSICDVTVVPDLVADLTLLLAELLENATSYSPPSMVVDVTAERTAAGCRVVIVDHGIGMSAEQLAEENDRFVRRERLDIAPTSVLGLFVVGRLARRHGLAVRLEPTPESGVTAVVEIPGRHLTTELSGAPDGTVTETRIQARVIPLPPPAMLPDPAAATMSGTDDFGWFAAEQADPDEPGPPPQPPGDAGADPAPSHPAAEQAPSRRPDGPAGSGPFAPGMTAEASGPGPFAPGMTSIASGPPDPGRVVRPVPGSPFGPMPSARPSFEMEPDPSLSAADPARARRSGLTRRVPGANLSPQARPRFRGEPAAAPVAPPRVRDPEQERAALDAFTAAVARAAADTESGQQPGPGEPTEEGNSA